MNNKKNLIIIIPFYKQDMDIFEEISLTQLKKVLGKYDICFIGPEGKQINCNHILASYKIETYDSSYFENTKSYSRLLLSTEFYLKYKNYKYMLIHQMDAFVFEDRVQEFINLGYDYYGAPMTSDDPSEYVLYNGGLSLRKIDSVIDVLEKYRDDILDNHKLGSKFKDCEDDFFSYCGCNKNIKFTVPPVRVAAGFSVQTDMGHGFRNIKEGMLPFGFHHWPNWNYRIWKPIVERLGYELPDIDIVESKDIILQERLRREETFLKVQINIHNNNELKREIIGRLEFLMNGFVIWGAGKDGLECLDLLNTLGLKPNYIVDTNKKGIIQGIPISELYKKSDNFFIIVATKKYEKEICNTIKSEGYSRFCSYTDLLINYVCPVVAKKIDIAGVTRDIEIL